MVKPEMVSKEKAKRKQKKRIEEDGAAWNARVRTGRFTQ